MTIKELYEKALEKGYENAEIGIDVTMHDREYGIMSDLYDEVLKPDQIDFGGLYESTKRIKDCIWIYIEAEGRS